jgi:hypothetical protein
MNAMGSPPSPATGNFKDDSEEGTLSEADYNPLCWFQYVDNMLMIWLHRPNKLNSFLEHLSSIDCNIQLTKETEKYGHLPFLDNLHKTKWLFRSKHSGRPPTPTCT